MNIMKSNATYKKQHYHQEGTGVAVSVVETKQLEKIQINWLRLSNCAFQFSSKEDQIKHLISLNITKECAHCVVRHSIVSRLRSLFIFSWKKNITRNIYDRDQYFDNWIGINFTFFSLHFWQVGNMINA